jgi:hypothetical protein
MPELATVRRISAGVGLLVGPPALLVAELLDPIGDDDPRELLQAVADHPTRFAIASWIQLAAVILLLPTLIGFLHVLRTRGTTLGHAAYALVNFGLVGYAADFGRRSTLDELAQGGVDQADVAFLDRLDDNLLYAVTGYLIMVAFVGFAVLGVALFRARLFHFTVPPLLGAAAVAGVTPIPDAVGIMLLGAAFGLAGFEILRMSNDRWGRVYEGPPRPTR